MWPVRFTTNSAKIYPPSGYCCPIPVRGSFPRRTGASYPETRIAPLHYGGRGDAQSGGMHRWNGCVPWRFTKSIRAITRRGFDSFYFWGEVLLNDFDQIDKYRVDADMLFSTCATWKDMDGDLSYFNEQQRAVVRRFLGGVRRGGGILMETRFLEYLAQSADDIPRVPGASGGAGARLYGDDAPPGCGAAAERRGVGGRWPSRGRRGFQCALGCERYFSTICVMYAMRGSFGTATTIICRTGIRKPGFSCGRISPVTDRAAGFVNRTDNFVQPEGGDGRFRPSGRSMQICGGLSA